jgi:hypothetical protein
MNFSSLSSNEKLAVYGSAAVIIGGIVGYGYGVGLLAVLAAIAMLAIVFLPQMSPTTNLPGSKGSLMLVAGGVAGVVLVLALLMYLGVMFAFFGISDLFFLIAVAGGVVMAWAGWQEFQAEGGKFQIGSTGAAPSAPAAPAVSSPPPAAPAPQAPAAPAEPAAPPTTSDPMGSSSATDPDDSVPS